MNAPRSHIALKVTATVVAAACLVRSPSAGAAAPAEACALLTQAEVSAALGVAVDAGQPLAPTEKRFCTWHEQGKDPLSGRNVEVNYLTDQQYERGKVPIEKVTKTPESGIGDDAYFSKAHGMVSVLSVKKGGTYFRISARTNPHAFSKSNTAENDEKDMEVDRAVARAILKKL